MNSTSDWRDGEPVPESSDTIVRFDNVIKRYPRAGGAISAVDGLDLRITAGEIFCLLGPNGAGKTTSIELMVGLRTATEGKVFTCGVNAAYGREYLRQVVSVQPQHAAVFDQQSVLELLSTWAAFYPNHESAESVIERLDLGECRKVRIAKLSGGQRQRVLVGLALVAKPRLLVLDEPSTGLDPNVRADLWSAVRTFRDTGGTVVLSTHSMEEAAQLSDRVAIMNRGRLAALGSADELIAIHAPDREVSFSAVPGLELAALHTLPEVLDVRVSNRADGDRITVLARDTDHLLTHLVGTLHARNIHVKDAGLSGVFQRVTGCRLGQDGAELAESGQSQTVAVGAGERSY